MTIGPNITCPYDNTVNPNADDVEEHGSFYLFNNNPGHGEHYIRLVVWRFEATGQVIGHNFDYQRFNSVEAWTAHQAPTPEDCADHMHYAWADKARAAVVDFRENHYAGLIAGTVELDEVRD